jgi:hypothetical protein
LHRYFSAALDSFSQPHHHFWQRLKRKVAALCVPEIGNEASRISSSVDWVCAAFHLTRKAFRI